MCCCTCLMFGGDLAEAQQVECYGQVLLSLVYVRSVWCAVTVPSFVQHLRKLQCCKFDSKIAWACMFTSGFKDTTFSFCAQFSFLFAHNVTLQPQNLTETWICIYKTGVLAGNRPIQSFSYEDVLHKLNLEKLFLRSTYVWSHRLKRYCLHFIKQNLRLFIPFSTYICTSEFHSVVSSVLLYLSLSCYFIFYLTLFFSLVFI